ncbi:MAG: class I SAM-dependent methyltransferase [Pirellulaceae bacterium]|jgi:SAM-dependent methyltransferase|nr:class I SAM-dependent methyltransferase [Pirellulaceae bacterium]
MNPQYTDQYLAAYYAQYFHDGQTPDLPIGNPDDGSRRAAAKTDMFRFLDRYTTPGRFLAIGCSDGIELLLAERSGWEAEGYDVDEGYMEALRKKLDNPIYSGDLFKLSLPDEHYDCVFMDQVLEHPKNPQDYLREVHRVLRPGGVLFIGCPNIRSISSRMKTILGKARLKQRRGRHYDMFHHLFFYDPRTLSRTLETYYGYEVLAAQGDPMTGHRTPEVEDTWRTRVGNWVRREFPVFESSFRLLARKPTGVSAATKTSRHAA